MNFTSFTSVLAPSFLGLILSAHAQEDLTVYEGSHISGGLFLGMSRAEVIEVSESNNCRSANLCTFRLPTVESRTLVELTFQDDAVSRIYLLTGGYTTSMGARVDMEPEEVASIYNTEVVRLPSSDDEALFEVAVPNLGYTFTTRYRCFRTNCVFFGEHEIYAPEGGSIPLPTPSNEPTPVSTPTPSMEEGYYLIQHKPSALNMYSCSDSDGDAIIASVESDECGQWQMVENGDYFYIKNASSLKHIRPDTGADGSNIVVRPSTWVGNWTQWSYEERGDGFGHLVNRATGKHVFASGEAGGTITQQPSAWRGDFTRWQFVLVE